MVSSMPEFTRPRHHQVWKALESFDAGFLNSARCYFGGGTRIVLELAEYRESADVDFLCADGAGYRKLRNTIKQNSLGAILKKPIPLSREVRADRYGIRTFLELDGQPVKFEIVAEGRIPLDADPATDLPVPALDTASYFAEKFLANSDRWADQSVLSRDVIDLAYMIKGWGVKAASAGMERATDAYGEVVAKSLTRAISKLGDDSRYFRRCLHELAISDSKRLRSGLRALSQMLIG